MEKGDRSRRAMGSLSHLEGKAIGLGHSILRGEIGQGLNRLQGCGIAKARAGALMVYLTLIVNKSWEILQWQTKSLYTLQLTGSVTY